MCSSDLMSKTKKKKKHRLFWHFFRIQLVLLVLVLTAAAYYFYGGYGKQVEELRQEAVRLVRQSDVDTFKANQTSIVYASDGSVISTLKGEKDSYYVSIEEMPVDAVTAIVSIEDKKFFRHHGIDYRALLRAVKAMVQNGEVKQGGSTITMQLARNIFFFLLMTWQRKVAPSQYENISLGRTICPWYHLTSVKPLSRIQETSDMPAL